MTGGQTRQGAGRGDWDVATMRAAFEEAPLAMALMSADPDSTGRFLDVNRAACELTGYSREELLRTSSFDLTVPGDVQRDFDLLQDLIAGRTASVSTEKRIVRRDGEVVWVSVERTVLRDEQGNVLFINTQARDVTEQRRMMQRLRCEQVVSRVLANSISGEGAISALLPGLAEALDCEAAFAWMVDSAGGVLACDVAWQAPHNPAPATAALSRELALQRDMGLPGRIWSRGSAGYTPDMTADPSCPRASAAAAEGLRAAVAFPVTRGSRVLGVIELIARQPRPDAPLLDALDGIGEQIGAFFHRRWTDHGDRKRRLLLVEDDDFIAALVSDMLAGVEPPLDVVRVGSLAKAREQLLDLGPACVLLDLTLPDADGLRGLVELRRIAPEAPIVVLTAHEDESLAVRAVQEGAQDYLIKRKVDMDGLARSIRYAIERRRSERRVFEDSLHDQLTGLPNRALLLDRARVMLARVGDRGKQAALLLLDINRFRKVNDRLGHAAGDLVITELADRLTGTTRSSTVAALGADRFAVLCDVHSPRDAAALAERLLAAVRRPIRAGDTDIPLEATIGISVHESNAEDAVTMLHEAEAARTRARDARASYAFFKPEAHARARARLQLETDLLRGLEQDQLRLLYQPIVGLTDGRIVAYEALLRWEHPERGLLAPGDFIGVAEESGLIVPMGAWAVAEACRQVATWTAAGIDGIAVNVNLSPEQVEQDDLPEVVADAIVGADVDPRSVCLEITERSLIGADRSALETLESLKALGVRLALDDFGTGYSSLSYLRRYPIDDLKVDRSLVTGLAEDQQLHAIVTAIVQMGSALGMPVIAEGVETPEDVEALRALGGGLAQGYHFARPLPPEAAGALADSGFDVVGGGARG